MAHPYAFIVEINTHDFTTISHLRHFINVIMLKVTPQSSDASESPCQNKLHIVEAVFRPYKGSANNNVSEMFYICIPTYEIGEKVMYLFPMR